MKRAFSSVYTSTYRTSDFLGITSPEDVSSFSIINQKQREAAWRTVLNNFMVAACLDVEINYLFMNSMKVEIGGKEEIASTETERKWIMVYRPFMIDVLRSINAQGFVVVRICRQADGGWIPVVPPWDTYIAYKVILLNGESKISVKWLRDKDEGEFVVYDTFGFSPLSNGDLTSPVMALLKDIDYNSALMRLILISSYWRANPPTAYERRGEFFQNQNSEYQRIRKMYMTGEEEDIRSSDVADEQRDIADFRSVLYLSKGPVDAPPLMNMRAIHRVPDQYHITAMPKVENVREDFVQQQIHLQDIIAIRMGVPRDFFMSKAAHTTNFRTPLYQAFSMKIASMAKHLSALLTDVYIFCESKRLVGIVKHKFTIRKYDKVIAELLLLMKYTTIRVVFTHMVFASLDELKMLKDEKAISESTFVELSSRLIGATADMAKR